MDIHDFSLIDKIFIYREVINSGQTPYIGINWIRINPRPEYTQEKRVVKFMNNGISS